MTFQEQVDTIHRLNLPSGQFIVVGSGPLAARNIRESDDIDIVVTEGLWAELAKKYPVSVNSSGIEIVRPEPNIEILSPAESVFGNSKIVSLEEELEHADIFKEIKYLSLEHLKLIKQELGREKDLADIALIDAYLSKQGA